VFQNHPNFKSTSVRWRKKGDDLQQSNISYKTIQKNTTLAQFTAKESEETSGEEE